MASTVVKEDSDSYLDAVRSILKRLAKHYERQGTEEIAVVNPGVVYHRLRQPDLLGRYWKPVRDESLSMEYLKDVCYAVSYAYGVAFHEVTTPVVYAVLPGKHRMTGICGTSVYYDEVRPEGGISIVIRQGPREDELHELEAWGIDASSTLGVQRQNMMRKIKTRHPSAYDAVFEAASAGEPILISGPTGSGKTTLLNRLLREINDDIRVVTVQDAPELNVMNGNRVNLLTARASDPESKEALDSKAVVDAVTRLRPEALLVGEISTKNAAMAIEVMGTGHGNFWTSIHASDPEEAFEAFATRAEHSKSNTKRDDLIKQLREKMYVIQIGHYNKERRITEIIEPLGHS